MPPLVHTGTAAEYNHARLDEMLRLKASFVHSRQALYQLSHFPKLEFLFVSLSLLQ